MSKRMQFASAKPNRLQIAARGIRFALWRLEMPMIVSEATEFGKLQGIRHLKPHCFACFNPPSTSERSNIIGSIKPDGLLRVPLVGR